MVKQLRSEVITSSRRKQGKRLLAVYETTKIELKNEIQQLVRVYENALERTNEALSMFPMQSRSRSLEASIVQSCFAEALMAVFPEKAFFGKYKRLVLHVKGYLVLFKKLNKKGFPMNIKTQNAQSISRQEQIADLFGESDYNDEPILYFGYQKSKVGVYHSPQIVYIDDGKIVFTVGEKDVQQEIPYHQSDEQGQQSEVRPKLKETKVLKKAN